MGWLLASIWLRIFLFAPVGLKGNLSLLERFLFFPGVFKALFFGGAEEVASVARCVMGITCWDFGLVLAQNCFMGACKKHSEMGAFSQSLCF